MPATLLGFVIDCRDSLAQARFWAKVLGHQISERNTDEYEVSDPTGPGTPLYFMNVPELKTMKNRLHSDITTEQPLEEEVTL